jgi:hypothetical protein
MDMEVLLGLIFVDDKGMKVNSRSKMVTLQGSFDAHPFNLPSLNLVALKDALSIIYKG